MKIALCMYGLVGSVSDKNGDGKPLDPSIAYNLNYENLIKDNDVDIFIHSWSADHKEELLSLYKPKKSIIEPQREFPESVSLLKNVSIRQRLKEFFLKTVKPDMYTDIISERKKYAFRAYSRWYSNKKAIELKREYEEEEGFKYDCVLILRLDVGFYSMLDLEKYDMDHFYASNWNDYPTELNDFKMNFENHNLGSGFLDFWFFSNSDYMDKFGGLFDDINKYNISPHRSSYEHVKSFTNKIKYTQYRWQDFEMIRRKEFSAKK